MTPNSTFIKLRELSSILGMEDTRTILKWLKSKGITCSKIGKDYVVDGWMVEFKLELDVVEGLKKAFPINWADIYRAKNKNSNMVEAVFVIHPPNATVTNRMNNNFKKFIE
jgi:hypothetical protein